MKPKVSVIIPAYNAESFIAQTIESVFAQTYDNYEVIVVDDGSTDQTLPVIESYVPRIRVFTKPNGGPASARNLAIKNSTGELLAFLDCDDLWVEEKLEEQVGYLNKHPEIGMLYSQSLMFTERDGEKKIIKNIGYTKNPSFRLLLFGNYIPNSAVVIRRECIEQVGLLNESGDLIGVEDYEYWMRITRIFPFAAISKPLVFYRIRKGNLVGEGKDIDKGVRLDLNALREIERQFPDVWRENNLDRDLLFARLHVRTGFAWKKRGEWKECLKRYLTALRISKNPRVFRWIIAATLLKRWS